MKLKPVFRTETLSLERTGTVTVLALICGLLVLALPAGGCRSESSAPSATTDPGAAECKQLIANAYELLENAHLLNRVRADACKAESLAFEAIATLREAQAACRPYFEKPPMLISAQALTNAEKAQERLAAKCSRG